MKLDLGLIRPCGDNKMLDAQDQTKNTARIFPSDSTFSKAPAVA